MKKLIFTLLVCGLSISAHSQTSKDEKIKKLLDLTGSGKLAIQMVKTLIPSFQKTYSDVPQEFWDDFTKEIKAEDLINLTVPIYGKYYSEMDVDQLIAFYNSPVGKKSIEVLPMIMQESMTAGQTWGRQIAEKVVQQLKENLFGS